MPKAATYEKRLSPRLASGPGDYVIHTGDSWTIRDLSVSGLFLLDRDPLPVGSPLFMELHLGNERLDCSGAVCRSVPGLGMGIQFKGLSRDAQSRLEKHLATLAKAAPAAKPPPPPAAEPSHEAAGAPSAAQELSTRLESLAAEFEELRHALKTHKVDLALLGAFRLALDRLRDTAWAVHERAELEVRDPGAPRPSLLTRDRIHRAAQLGENLGLEIASEEAPLDAEALEELFRSIQNLHQRLSLYFKPES